MIEAVALRRLPDISMRSQHVRRGVHGWRSGVAFRTHGRVLGAAFVVIGAPAGNMRECAGVLSGQITTVTAT